MRSILKTLYEATGGPSWVNREGWLSDAPLGEWYGVEVDGFGRHGLRGSIPAELGDLTDLQHLWLGHNALTGSIPAELGNPINLRRLQLRNNGLTGPIPPELGTHLPV